MVTRKPFGYIIALFVCFAIDNIKLLSTTDNTQIPPEENNISSSISLEIPLDKEQEQHFKQIKNITNATRATTCNNEDAQGFFDLLITSSTLNPLLDFLQQDLYHKTYPPVTRSIHDLPQLSSHILTSKSTCWNLGITPYWNTTPRMYFTSHSDKIGSYVSFSPTAIQDAQTVLDNIHASFPQSPRINLGIFSGVISIIESSTLEERRLGALITTWKKHHRWLLSLALPISYVEHNIFISDEDQDTMRRQLVFTGGSVGNISFPGYEYDSYRLQHFVCDKFGLGDLRFQALYNILDQENKNIKFGGQITLPTACTIAKGFQSDSGACPCKNPHQPYVDLYSMAINLVNSKITAAREWETILDYATAFLDRLDANILNRSLGQQHVYIGPVFHAEASLGQRGWTSLDLELEIPFPQCEKRFFKYIINPAYFRRNYTDESQACANMDFLSQQLSNILYVPVVKMVTWPGVIGKATGFYGMYIAPQVKATIGYDFWWQSKEHLVSMENDYGNYDPLDFAAGTRHAAYEGKLLGSLMGCFETQDHSVNLGLLLDGTLHSRGIGKSYTVSVHFDMTL